MASDHDSSTHTTLREEIDHAAHLLPAQGPITVFIHHNTLHAFEEEHTFDEGLKMGSDIFGCETYLSEQAYRDRLAKGRIDPDDVAETLREDLGARASEQLRPGVTRFDVQLAMMLHPMKSGPASELRWHIAETDALKKIGSDIASEDRLKMIANTRRWVMRDFRTDFARGAELDEFSKGLRDHFTYEELVRKFSPKSPETWDDDLWEAFTLQSLWRICSKAVNRLPSLRQEPRPIIRHRDLLWKLRGVDLDASVNDLLIRFCAAFLDQGVANWNLPDRFGGFLSSFCELYARPGGPPDGWLRSVARECRAIRDGGKNELELIQESLDLLGVGGQERGKYIEESFLALRGWAGMIQQVETRPDRVALPILAGSLDEFLAVRLLLDRCALRQYLEANDRSLTTRDCREAWRKELPRHETGAIQQAFRLFQLSQILGWSVDQLLVMGEDEWRLVQWEIHEFDALERRRLFQMAFERRFRNQSLDAISLHPRFERSTSERTKFQAIFCLDEREESFRRHLEEVEPKCETYGAAGFFIVAMYYRGAADAHYVPLCPVVIRPQHWVCEKVDQSHAKSHQVRSKRRRLLGNVSHRFHVSSRSFALGAILSAGLGVLAFVPLLMRILFPRLTGRIRGRVGDMVRSPDETKLQLERKTEKPGHDEASIGFSLEEMTNISERLLRDIGLTKNFARVVIVAGHGSNSVNNPHKSAYDCGACGGNAGGPNARACASMLNDRRVREALATRGIRIPDDTHFVGSFHNTCNDSVTFFDVPSMPASHQAEMREIQASFRRTSERNAHERCRRFVSASLTMSPEAALHHVEGRAEDLSQTRPECGHATNALCIVARRERTRGLYLDRRAFLTSYDPLSDGEDSAILTRILAAAFPVCGGINLEYYFSYVDSAGWGCGTKLPHNITSLLGVMDGAGSDLRTGLPWQMVEIHEPVRLLFVIETTPEAMTRIMDKNPGIGILARNVWVQLSLLDPNSNQVLLYKAGQFVPYLPGLSRLPKATTSIDWYRGWREHLEFAEITG